MRKATLLLLTIFISYNATPADIILDKEICSIQKDSSKAGQNIAYQWGSMALTATANDTEKFNPRPTIIDEVTVPVTIACC
ncbi:hypothetical protein V5739_11625 [Salinimicrobium sp. TIG7-5_MAKvit]|uniref:hypothetical protein n=1 Tax=Salinimicrobium sp. TIG7-5_MAKvit TaxID=3121289 RepID=UPI003C6DD539